MNLADFVHPKVWKKMHCLHGPSLNVHNTETSCRLRFQKLVSNARANLFPKLGNKITKYFAFYRCITVDTCDLNAGR